MVNVDLLANVDLSSRVGNSFLLMSEFIIFPSPTRFVHWPVTACVSIKVIINITRMQGRSFSPPCQSIWYYTSTSCCHVLYILTTHWSMCLCDQTSTIWLTNNPIIDVWLDHEIFPNVLPKIPVYSPTWWLTERRSGWDWDIGERGRPIWTGGYSITWRGKTAVICKGVAVNQGPASLMSCHITVNLKGF